jgi:hypothetical protein
MDYGPLTSLRTNKKTYLYFAKRSIAACLLGRRRKVRATQSILLPNGKAPAAGDSKCHRKYTALVPIAIGIGVRVKT